MGLVLRVDKIDTLTCLETFGYRTVKLLTLSRGETGVSPALLMTGRQIRTTLSMLDERLQPSTSALNRRYRRSIKAKDAYKFLYTRGSDQLETARETGKARRRPAAPLMMTGRVAGDFLPPVYGTRSPRRRTPQQQDENNTKTAGV
ncbi:unnamed protein product [Merluccius merluccius]